MRVSNKNILSCLPTLFPVGAKTAVTWEDDKAVLIIFSLKKGAWEEVLPWIGGQSFSRHAFFLDKSESAELLIVGLVFTISSHLKAFLGRCISIITFKVCY